MANEVEVQRTRQYATVTNPVPMLDTANYEHMMRLATVMGRASLMPKHLRGADDAASIGNAFLIVNQAMRWGMDPFALAQSTFILPNGMVGYDGKSISAAIKSVLKLNLDYEFFGEEGKPTRGIIASGSLPGSDKILDVKGTVAQWQTTDKDNRVKFNWASQPDDQLIYRSTRQWARRYAPSLLLGVYTDDEMDDLEDRYRGQTARDVTAPPPPTTDTAAAAVIERRPSPPVPREERAAYGESGEQPDKTVVWGEGEGEVEDQDGKSTAAAETTKDEPAKDEPKPTTSTQSPPPPSDDEQDQQQQADPAPKAGAKTKAAAKPKVGDLPAHHKPDVLAKLLTDLRREVDRCETSAQLDAVCDNFRPEIAQTTDQTSDAAQAIVTAKYAHFELIEKAEKQRAAQAKEAGADTTTGEIQQDQTAGDTTASSDAGTLPEPLGDEAPVEPMDDELEDLLDRARGRAINGRKALTMWLNAKLTAEQRDKLRPHDKGLYEAADRADTAKPSEG